MRKNHEVWLHLVERPGHYSMSKKASQFHESPPSDAKQRTLKWFYVNAFSSLTGFYIWKLFPYQTICIHFSRHEANFSFKSFFYFEINCLAWIYLCTLQQWTKSSFYSWWDSCTQNSVQIVNISRYREEKSSCIQFLIESSIPFIILMCSWDHRWFEPLSLFDVESYHYSIIRSIIAIINSTLILILIIIVITIVTYYIFSACVTSPGLTRTIYHTNSFSVI